MAHQYIFVMKDLKKIVPPKREILKGIWLSFYPGAKIGVIGGNGAGKSTLLRIMAGVDRDFLGEAWPADGVRVGYLPQEPRLDPAKDVRGNVEEGVAQVRGLLTRFDEINAKLGEPLDDDEMEKVLAEQARVQDAIEAANGWDLDRTVEIAMDALRCPPGDADVGTLSGGEVRRVALCRLLLQKPDLLLLDEPSLGLAPLVVREIFRIVRTINQHERVSVLLVEQNASLALGLADHAYLMETGTVVMSGPAAELRENDAIRQAYLGY